MAGTLLKNGIELARSLSTQVPSVPFHNPYLERDVQRYFPTSQPTPVDDRPTWSMLDQLQAEREKDRDSYDRRLSQQANMLNQYERTLGEYRTSLAQQPYMQPTQNQGLGYMTTTTGNKSQYPTTQQNTGILNFSRSYTYSPTHRVLGLPSVTERMIDEEHAKIGGLPVTLIKAIAKRESGGNQNVTSSAGARGIMQIIPKYANEFGGGDVINDPRANIRVGINEINSYYKRFGDVGLALLAYNWGPGNVASYLKTGRGIKGQPIPKEAREYVDLVLNNIRGI